ncbi:MAG: hypothetical protein COB02_03680 [Candidatus Cloacimonadota bacterium]|nr:MAG: hypothetical protein COB02_03680 [Candidatus Cloacimonadota bacterium]
MRYLIIFLMCSVVESVERPLSIVVGQIETKFECKINFPEKISTRKTNVKVFVSLKKALNSLFYKESFVIQKKSGIREVKVYEKNFQKLGNLGESKIIPRKILIKGKETLVDSNSLILSFNKKLSRNKKIELLEKFNLKYDSRSLNQDNILIRTSASVEEKLIKKISNENDVRVDYNYLIKVAGNEAIAVNLAAIKVTDEFYNQQWGHQSVNGHVGYLDEKSKLIKIVVLDTGVNLSHEDLVEGKVSNRDFSDDLLVDNDNNGHGTGVVGIIGAVWNGKGISGLTGTDIISVKVFDH